MSKGILLKCYDKKPRKYVWYISVYERIVFVICLSFV